MKRKFSPVGKSILMCITVQITLDQKRLTIRQGVAGSTLRPQRIQFNHIEQARWHILKIEHLKASGFLINAG